MTMSNEEQTSDNAQELSVTVITTNRLPTYSAERYYVLNEIEQHAFTMQNLDDINDTDSNNKISLSAHVIFYLIWDDRNDNDPNNYVDNIVSPAITKLRNHISFENNCNIYVVIDKLSLHDNLSITAEDFHVQQIELCEKLLGIITKCHKLRNIIQGVTIGVANTSTNGYPPPTAC